jgi:hypothetical protein
MKDIIRDSEDIISMGRIKLGDKVRDTVTGFEGIATGRSETLHANNIIRVEATHLSSMDNMPLDDVMFPEDRLEKVGD